MDKLFKGRGGEGREKINEVAIGVAEEQRAITPGHGGRGLHERVAQIRDQSLVVGIHVGHPQLDDSRAVGGGARHPFATKGGQGARVADSQGAPHGTQLAKAGRGADERLAAYGFIKAGEALKVGGNEANGCEVHAKTGKGVRQQSTRTPLTTLWQSVLTRSKKLRRRGQVKAR
jgi:hypothetical protein